MMNTKDKKKEIVGDNITEYLKQLALLCLPPVAGYPKGGD
jgi:hypothetical protein